jgi:hypothetical protein
VNIPSILLWGFLATLVLSSVMSGAQGLGLSRMSEPYMIGTMLTTNRRRAWVAGFGLHFLNGWLFACIYALVFETLHRASWWGGLLLGLLHGMVVLVVFMPMMPHFHPRMVDDRQGPEPTWELEPPGFLALNYGRRTPLFAMLAHALYGLVLGAFYQVRP